MGRPSWQDDGYGGGRGGGAAADKEFTGQKARNQQAAEEGRAVYVRGIPFSWSSQKLGEWFGHQGEVESVNLLPPKPGQQALAAFVNYTSHEDAMNAAQVCDNLSVDDDDGQTYNLVCSIKAGVGQKVEMVSGFTDLSKARQEKRSVYISGMPISYGEAQVKELLGPYGVVEEVCMLPEKNRNLSCFAILSSPEEAQGIIDTLDGQVVDDKQLSVTLPRPPKRTRAIDETTPIEIRGFPLDWTIGDIHQTIESAGHEVVSVKILRHGSIQESSIAVVYLNTREAALSVVKELHNFSFAPGSVLQCQMKEMDADGELGQQSSVNRPPLPPMGGPRCKGDVVGRLKYDRTAYEFAGEPPTAAMQPGAQALSNQPRPPRRRVALPRPSAAPSMI